MMLAGVRRRWLFLLAWAALAPAAFAEARRPAPPREYHVELRYRIQAGRVERLRQFHELIRVLEQHGFRKEPGSDTEAEDPGENRMTGTISSNRVRELLVDPRVKTLLLSPAGYQLPAEGAVKVQIELAGGLPTDRQLLLEEQTRSILQALGFKEKLGYDHRQHTRLLGTIPVEELDTLLKDLRSQPAGWLMPQTPGQELPLPLRGISPVRVVELLPEPEGVPAAREAPPETPAPEVGREFLLKIAPDLHDLAMKEGDTAPRRLEVILDHVPTPGEPGWRGDLTAAGAVIEGRLGPLVTVLAPAKAAARLAELPEVSTVRLARPALVAGAVKGGDRTRDVLRDSGLERLHTLGHQGQGVRVAVVDGDFRGYRRLLGKQLPANTRYVDLTAERSPDLQPDPFAGDPNALGHGTESALAVALAAPKAELTLVRVDPAAPHQLQEVARYLHGEDYRSESSFRRSQELTDARAALAARQAKLAEERKVVLDRFTDTSEREHLSKVPPEKLTAEEKELLQEIQRHDAYFKAVADFDRDEKALRERTRRFVEAQAAFRELRNNKVVVSSLVWNEGLPLGSDSSLSRYFEEKPFRSALWFQSAGNTRGQAWSGLFRDADGNGVMEFAPADALRPGRWSPELNFLAWQPHGQAVVPDLPAKAKIRLTLQWRESHDPELFRQEKDLYREPLAKLRLVVVRQRDPRGEKLAADDLELVARSEGLPQRLENQPTYAVYEQAVEFTADPAGRYAVRVEGRVPATTRPPAVPTLPSMQRNWELRPRLFAEVVEPSFRGQGRAVFLDYPTEVGALGAPADAREVVTVGAAARDGTEGTPFHAELSVKPDVLGYAGLVLGLCSSDQAAAFTAGLSAASLSAGKPRGALLDSLRRGPAAGVRVP